MLARFLTGLFFAATLAVTSGNVYHLAAAPSRTIPVVSRSSPCETQPAAFTVQVTQGVWVFSPKRLVVHGTCFLQGASITIWDSMPASHSPMAGISCQPPPLARSPTPC